MKKTHPILLHIFLCLTVINYSVMLCYEALAPYLKQDHFNLSHYSKTTYKLSKHLFLKNSFTTIVLKKKRFPQT
jgi:hypothetical protein